MEANAGKPTRYAFGPFVLDAADRQLTRDGEPVHLRPKAMNVLLAFVESPRRVLSKDDLIQRVWSGTFVEESNLNFQIHEIRQALGDNAKNPKYVRTVPGRGFEFIVLPVPVAAAVPTRPTPAPQDVLSVTLPVDEQSEPTVPQAVSPVEEGRRAAWLAPLALLLLAVPALISAPRFREPPFPRLAGVTKLTHDGLAKDSLILFDRSRLLVTTRLDQTLVTIDGTGHRQPSEFSEFYLLDVSLARSEAVATKPHDRGAEDALWVLPLAGGSPWRLGMARVDGAAAWSNDGEHIAYSFANKLFSTDRRGIEQNELQAFSGGPLSLRWSPDDRFIRFTLAAFSDRTVTTTLMDIAADGTRLTRLIDRSGDSLGACCGSWIPGGWDFVYEAGTSISSEIWLLRGPKSSVGRPSLEQRRLSPDALEFSRPVASPDGKRIFTIGRLKPELARWDTARRELVPYLSALAVRQLDFSRDAKQIAYVGFPGRPLWRARSDGSDARQLTVPPLEIHGQPAWSPDGALIAFRGQMPGKRAKVYLISAEGGDPKPLEERDVEQGIPTWSPDGTRLTFGDVPERYGRPTGSERIHIYDLVRREIADVPGSNRLWSSRWSPDGRYLAALTIDGQELMLFDLTTKQWRSLGVSHANNPAWSRDSQYVYLDPQGDETWSRRVRIADGALEHLVDLSTHIFDWVGVTPDGSPLISRRLVDVYALELERR